jgi:hypothetical protein
VRESGFEREIRNRKKERATETLNLKLNTKPLKFKCGLADGGGWAGWSTHARHGYPHLVLNNLKRLKRKD